MNVTRNQESWIFPSRISRQFPLSLIVHFDKKTILLAKQTNKSTKINELTSLEDELKVDSGQRLTFGGGVEKKRVCYQLLFSVRLGQSWHYTLPGILKENPVFLVQ